jgi:hypothetical protein
VELLSGRTVCLELLDGEALDEAAACAEVWRRAWPDVGLVVPLPDADPVDRVRGALERAGLEASALVVEVAGTSAPAGLSAVEALGVGVVVKVPASSPDLVPAVAAARAFGGQVVVTGVSSIVAVGDAGQAGADAAQGAYLGAPLDGLDAVLAHLAEEATVGATDTVVGRVAGLEARAEHVQALVDELSGAEGRGAGSAAPRSARSGPRGA